MSKEVFLNACHKNTKIHSTVNKVALQLQVELLHVTSGHLTACLTQRCFLINLVNKRHIALVLPSFPAMEYIVYWVCKPAYLVLVPSQDKGGGLQQEGHPVWKMGDDGGGSLVSPGEVVPTRMVGVFASVIFFCTIKVQKISSGTGSPGWSQKRDGAVKRLCVYACVICLLNMLAHCSFRCVETFSSIIFCVRELDAFIDLLHFRS